MRGCARHRRLSCAWSGLPAVQLCSCQTTPELFQAASKAGLPVLTARGAARQRAHLPEPGIAVGKQPARCRVHSWHALQGRVLCSTAQRPARLVGGACHGAREEFRQQPPLALVHSLPGEPGRAGRQACASRLHCSLSPCSSSSVWAHARGNGCPSHRPVTPCMCACRPEPDGAAGPTQVRTLAPRRRAAPA